jgi:hypothetical protein
MKSFVEELFALKMEAARFSATSINIHQSTRLHISEDSNL